MLLPFDLPAVRRKKLTWILMAGGSPNRHFELAIWPESSVIVRTIMLPDQCPPPTLPRSWLEALQSRRITRVSVPRTQGFGREAPAPGAAESRRARARGHPRADPEDGLLRVIPMTPSYSAGVARAIRVAVSERVIAANWTVAVGASPIGTLVCVDAWRPHRPLDPREKASSRRARSPTQILIPIFWRRIAITAANPPRSWFDARRAHALRVEPGVFCTSARTDCVAGHIGLEL
jgi:hypothetical protein